MLTRSHKRFLGLLWIVALLLAAALPSPSFAQNRGSIHYVSTECLISVVRARSNLYIADFVGQFTIESSTGQSMTGCQFTTVYIDTDQWHIVPISPSGPWRSNETWSQIRGGIYIDRTLYLANGERLAYSGGFPRQGVSVNPRAQTWFAQTVGWYKDGDVFRKSGNTFTGRLADSLGHSRGFMGAAGGWGTRVNLQFADNPYAVIAVEYHPIVLN